MPPFVNPWQTELEQLVEERGKRAIRGNLNAWNLPQYAPAVQNIRTQGSRRLEDLARTFPRTGIRGPAAGTLLEKSGESTGGDVLNLTNTMAGVPEQFIGQGEAAGASGWERAMGMAKLKEAREARHLQEREAKQQSQQGFGQSMMNKCCFLFIMGEGDVLDEVQKFKYEHFGYDSHVANGYRWMSLKLMPFIKRNRYAKKLIKFLITQPLSRFATHYYNHDSRALLYAPVGLFWCTTWEMIGRISKYNSQSYQKMVETLNAIS
jgi:hypothetical protein